LRAISTLTLGVTLVTLNGPVPAGALANSVQLRPAFSHAVGLTNRMRVTR